ASRHRSARPVYVDESSRISESGSCADGLLFMKMTRWTRPWTGQSTLLYRQVPLEQSSESSRHPKNFLDRLGLRLYCSTLPMPLRQRPRILLRRGLRSQESVRTILP